MSQASLVVQMVKNLPEMWEIQVWSLGREDPLEKKSLPTPVFLPREFHEPKSLAVHGIAKSQAQWRE